jgi:hypothetical protein
MKNLKTFLKTSKFTNQPLLYGNFYVKYIGRGTVRQFNFLAVLGQITGIQGSDGGFP